MNHLQKSRVSVDFFAHERDVLQELCEQDIRPPAEQLRWLVLNEARRRGLQNPKMNNRHDVNDLTGQHVTAVSGIHP